MITKQNVLYCFALTLAFTLNSPIALAAEFGLDERPANVTCLAPDRPPEAGTVTVELVLSNSQQPVDMKQVANDASRWFVVEINGVLKAYNDGQTFSEIGAVLDITDRVTTLWEGDSYGELGLLGIAVHPNFENNGEIFLYYTSPGPSAQVPLIARLSRFTSFDNGLTFDPDSEEVLLSLDQVTKFHKGGGMAFGDDGYLYISLGNGGERSNRVAQDVNNLKGSMLRLDVDSQSPYGIPPDNPFAVSGGRPEIYAWGFRNPWRWSFDRETGDIWLGDVGGNAWEEVNRIVKGGNYGWPIREGAYCVNDPCSATGLIDPVVEYSHDNGPAAIIGGFVYRGSAIPALQGTYVYGDNPSGELWALYYDEQNNADPQLIYSGGGIRSISEGNDRELYLLSYTKIYRVIKTGDPVPSTFPQMLSETGCVDPVDPTKSAPGVIPYDVSMPLWSDGAVKQRWMAIPDGTFIDINKDDDWDFPIGTVLMKSFSLKKKLIETRLLVRHTDGGWAGYSYEWDEAQTNATLLPAGKTKFVGIKQWAYPSRSQCFQCHTSAAGRSLGPETAQMNRWITYPSTGRSANQVKTLDHIGMFTVSPGLPKNLPRLVPLNDLSIAVDLRARSYLHANCSFCHRPGGPGRGPEDFRHFIPLSDIGAVDEMPTEGDFGIAGARLLVPGKPDKSVISYRMHTLDLGRMPALGSFIEHVRATTVIDEWILNLGPSCADSVDGEPNEQVGEKIVKVWKEQDWNRWHFKFTAGGAQTNQNYVGSFKSNGSISITDISTLESRDMIDQVSEGDVSFDIRVQSTWTDEIVLELEPGKTLTLDFSNPESVGTLRVGEGSCSVQRLPVTLKY